VLNDTNKSYSLLCAVICILRVTIFPCSLDIPFIGAGLLHLMPEISLLGYRNSDQSVSLIPKWDLGITNFLILDTGIENSILELQSLRVALRSVPMKSYIHRCFVDLGVYYLAIM